MIIMIMWWWFTSRRFWIGYRYIRIQGIGRFKGAAICGIGWLEAPQSAMGRRKELTICASLCYLSLVICETFLCNPAHYEAKYINENDMVDRMQGNTPVLLSFAGSGSTWARLLIESATGIYTGSVYEKDLVLPNRPCGLRTAIVSAHATDFVLDVNKLLKLSAKPRRIRCRRGMIASFKRVLFLGR
jgi:hypothetical protein